MANDKDRLLVAIGVSKPDGQLEALPGAITAAKRMAAWAEAHEYVTRCVTDEGGREVTVDLLRTEIATAIDGITSRAPLKRLVIFFAGHGAAHAVGDQYWMLSRWDTRPTEAIKVAALQRMLAYYGPEQVAIIGDACQEYSARFLDVIGSAVLDKPREEPRPFELDQFFAVDVGKQAFMVKGANGTDAFCIFTEVLLDALEGEAPHAWEKVGAAQAVTSQTLAAHLMRAVAQEAGKHGVRMTPRPLPGFYTDRTYVTMPDRGPAPPAAAPPPSPAVAFSHEDSGDPAGQGHQQEREARRASFAASVRAADVRPSFETGAGVCVSGATVKRIDASFADAEELEDHPNWFRFHLHEQGLLGWSDALVTVHDGRLCHVCAVEGYVAALHLLPDTVSLFHRPIGNSDDVADLMIDMQAQLYAGTVTPDQITDMAAMVGDGGHRLLTMSCLAAQFYDAIHDVDSLRQLASFIAQQHRPVPLDIVLYGGGTIMEENGWLFAQIPEVPILAERAHARNRRPFSRSATPGFDMHPIAGRIPWMREAWSAVATAQCDESAETWRADALEAMSHLRAGAFTTFSSTREGRQAALTLAGGRLMPDATPSITY